MIVCVCPNPAIDRTYVVPNFAFGEIYRPDVRVAAAGGKGPNVVRAVKGLGGVALGMGFAGGLGGAKLTELMDEEGLAHQWTPITGETRTCIIIADTSAGTATVVNEHGPVVTADEWTRFVSDVTAVATRAEKVCFCGSMIRGADAAEYAALVGSVAKHFVDSSRNERRVCVWVDTSGAALKAMLTVPYIGIKVNGDEAGAILGRAVVTPEEAIAAAHDLMQHGALGVVLTLGKRGAVKVTNEGAWAATPPTIRVLDPIGSGDSFLAGLVTAQAQRLPAGEQLRHAVAAGTANALSVGGGAFSQAEFERVLSETSLKQL